MINPLPILFSTFNFAIAHSDFNHQLQLDYHPRNRGGSIYHPRNRHHRRRAGEPLRPRRQRPPARRLLRRAEPRARHPDEHAGAQVQRACRWEQAPEPALVAPEQQAV